MESDGGDGESEREIVEILNSRKNHFIFRKENTFDFRKEKLQNSFGIRVTTYT